MQLKERKGGREEEKTKTKFKTYRMERRKKNMILSVKLPRNSLKTTGIKSRLSKLQDTFSIYKKSFYFYILVMKNPENKIKKIMLFTTA